MRDMEIKSQIERPSNRHSVQAQHRPFQLARLGRAFFGSFWLVIVVNLGLEDS